MKKENLPMCSDNDSIKNVIHTITDGKCGLVVVVKDSSIKGVITDGDIRRAMKITKRNFSHSKLVTL